VKFTTTAPRAETIAKGQREALQSEVADLESRVALRESEPRGLAAGRQRAVAIVSRKGGDESGAAGDGPPAKKLVPAGLRPLPQRRGEPVMELQRRHQQGCVSAARDAGKERKQEQSI
jgi:hypothetical protein